MAYYGADEWEGTFVAHPAPPPPRPTVHHGHSSRDYRRTSQYLNPENGYGGGTSMHRTRSQGHSPAPVINVFNDVNQEANQRGSANAPPHAPYPPAPAPPGAWPASVPYGAAQPATASATVIEHKTRSRSKHRHHSSSSRSSSREGRGRSRIGDAVAQELLAERMATLAIENERLRSRSRGRSDFSMDRRAEYATWESERYKAEARDREQRNAWEVERLRREVEERERRAAADREEDRIRNEIKIKTMEAEAKRKADDAAAKAEQDRLVADYERKRRDAEDKREAEERALRDRLRREEIDKAEKDKAAKQALQDQIAREKAKAAADRQALKDQLDREEHEAKEEQKRQWEAYERAKKEKEDEEKRQWAEFERKQKEKEEKAKAEEKERQAEVELEMRRRLEKQGYSLTYIEHIIKGNSIKEEGRRASILPPPPVSLSPPRTSITTTTTTRRSASRSRSRHSSSAGAMEPWQPSRQPVYAKIHRDYLSIDTLIYYDIPYEFDPDDSNYIIILREMSKTETNLLFEHTARLRSGRLLLEDSKKKEPQYAWYRKRDRSRSTSGRKEVKKFGILEISK
ncbi:hypothetical protein K431DRAFT_41562 [Polychaeton citri CBS 116435]|uniref:Uncharacterized protein n=1 Tax=Polychaeton citri CBS 116435 TaxID=1314669 RepID=A0A9P4QAV1_9PEZI|nr:hypothetical protein K431DRAFT_41562 [Polychaeton citri CBS 116435]